MAISLHRHRAGTKRSDKLVDKIIRMTIQTGALTTVFVNMDMFLYLFDPTGLHFVLGFFIAKLYINSFLATLNARKGWASPPSSQTWNHSFGLSNLHAKATQHSVVDSGRKTGAVQLSIPPRPEVDVDVESYEMRDYRGHSLGQKGEVLEVKDGDMQGGSSVWESSPVHKTRTTVGGDIV